MANFFSRLVGDVAGGWEYITGGAAANKQFEQLNAQNQADYAARYAPGGASYNKIAATQGVQVADAAYQTVQSDYSNAAAQESNYLDQLDQAGTEGAQSGLDNVTALPGKIVGGVTGIAGSTLWGVLKNIPWWVWLVALGFLFFYLGGGLALRSRGQKLIGRLA